MFARHFVAAAKRELRDSDPELLDKLIKEAALGVKQALNIEE